MIIVQKAMNSKRPSIQIGIIGDMNTMLLKVKYYEVTYGIEEEGCFYSIYEATDIKDLHYETVDVCVIVSSDIACIYSSDIKNGQLLYSIRLNTASIKNGSLRNLGKNAARYLKGKSLNQILGR